MTYTYGTECWSQGRAKLRDFPRHLAREITRLSLSLTPTLCTYSIMPESFGARSLPLYSSFSASYSLQSKIIFERLRETRTGRRGWPDFREKNCSALYIKMHADSLSESNKTCASRGAFIQPAASVEDKFYRRSDLCHKNSLFLEGAQGKGRILGRTA